MRAVLPRGMRPVALTALIGGAFPPAATATGLLEYSRESRMLIDAPGAAGSLAAAFFNPAAPVVQGQAGIFAALSDAPGARFGEGDGHGRRPWAALATARYATFGARRLWADPAGQDTRVDEYLAALAAGNRSFAVGLAHAWNSEPARVAARHRYLLAGAVRRWRALSVGASAAFDLEREDNYVQADLGLRPLGPRVTLFADAVCRRGQSAEEMDLRGGIDWLALPGVRLGASVAEGGAFGLGLTLGATGNVRASGRMLCDEDGHHATTTWALESGSWQPPAGHGLGRGGGTYRRLSLAGAYTYQRFRLFDRRRPFLRALRAINACAEDPRVAGAVVSLSGARMDGEAAWELRAQLAGLRARGKKVIVYADRLGTYGMMLASVADQLWLDPQGGLSLRGLALGRTYYAGAFEKAGVGFDELRFFTYKSAAEIGARTSMSPAEREQRQALVDDAYETVADLVTGARGIPREAWDRLVDECIDLAPAEARAAGLIDSIGTCEQAFEAARKAAPRGTPDRSAAALAGVMGDPAGAALDWGEPDRVAVLYAIGDCAMETGIRGPVLAAAVKRAREDRRVKAVVLRVDSPGGERLPSDLVAREMIATAAVKPVIVSQGSVAASGGYYLSMEADTIVTSPLTRTGSIGVIGAFAWDKGLGVKLGLAYDGVRRGAHADYLSGWRLPFAPAALPHRPMLPEERSRAEELIRTMYAEFVGHVAAARGQPKEEIEALAQGRVWSGTRALKLGLVDVEGGLWEALRLARLRAGLPVDRPVELAEGPAPEWIDPALYTLLEIPGLESRTETPGLEAPAGGLADTRGLEALPRDSVGRRYLEMLLSHPGEPLLLAGPDEVVEVF